MRTVAIIFDRMHSTRLPGKTFYPLDTLNRTSKEIMYSKLQRLVNKGVIDEVCFAVPNSSETLAEVIRGTIGARVFVAQNDIDESDVYTRMIQAAKYFGADIVVDLTADCPMVDPNHIEKMLEIFHSHRKGDENFYTSNVMPRCWPDGFDAQVYNIEALENVNEPNLNWTGWNIAISDKPWPCLPIPKDCDFPEWRLTLDTERDYKRVSKVFDLAFKYYALTPSRLRAETIIQICKDHAKEIGNMED